MCTAVLSMETGLPVLLAGIRDELTDRPWQPPARHWPGDPDLIGGRDLQAGGTWLAVSPARRRVSCVLNGTGKPAPPQTRRSRGELPLLAAAGDMPTETDLADFDPFRLIVAEPGRAMLHNWDGSALIERDLPDGLHFVVNSGYASDLAGSAGMATDWAGPDWQGSGAARWQGARACAGRLLPQQVQVCEQAAADSWQSRSPTHGAHGSPWSTATASDRTTNAPWSSVATLAADAPGERPRYRLSP